MAIKAVWFFNRFKQGWSETYYFPGTDPQGVSAQFGQQIYQLAMQMRSQGTYLYGARYSLVGTPRNFYTYVFGDQFPSPANAPLAPPAPPEVSAVDALVKWFNFDNTTHFTFLRGLSPKQVIFDPTTGAAQPSAQLQSQVNAFKSAMTKLGWTGRHQQRPPVGGSIWMPVNQVAPQGGVAGGPGTDLTIPSQYPGLVNGVTQVVFQGVPKDNLPGFPNVATVQSQSGVAPWTITIKYRMRWDGSSPFHVPPNMRFTVQSYIYSPVFSFQIQTFSEHKAGRPFGVPRGRARPTVRAL